MSCPSCGTRYHHRAQAGQEAGHGRCSQCDGQVPLVGARRSYVLGPAPLGIGMDDPLLAEQLRATAPDATPRGRPEAMTYRVTAGAEPPQEVEAAPDAPPRETFRELLVTMLMTTLGAAATYYVARDQGLDVVFWAAVGGGWGLLVGWVCIRWMRR